MEFTRKSVMWERLQGAWEHDPIQVLAAGALAIGAVAKLIDALSAAKGRRAYAKQVNYRVRGRR